MPAPGPPSRPCRPSAAAAGAQVALLTGAPYELRWSEQSVQSMVRHGFVPDDRFQIFGSVIHNKRRTSCSLPGIISRVRTALKDKLPEAVVKAQEG